MPEISVIIPVYNTEKYLEQCLDSVLGQTFSDIEVICVDDGSSDGSPAILEKYAAQDARMTVVRQPNAGAGAARNNGLRRARGKYLSFLDADDFFEPEMLEKAYRKAEECRADFVVFNSNQYYTDKNTFVTTPWVLRMNDIPPYAPFTYRQLTNNIFKTFVGWAWDKLYLRSFVLEKGLLFQEQRTTNDMLFVFSALVVAKRIAVVNEVLAHQRRDVGDSLSHTREKSWFCFYDALTALRGRIEKEGVFWELERDFINYALHFTLWNLNSLAEPTHAILLDKLRTEWFADLGIAGKPKEYFYNKGEYDQYLRLIADARADK